MATRVIEQHSHIQMQGQTGLLPDEMPQDTNKHTAKADSADSSRVGVPIRAAERSFGICHDDEATAGSGECRLFAQICQNAIC